MRTVGTDVVEGPQVRAIPAPGPGHVALILQPRSLEQGEPLERDDGLKPVVFPERPRRSIERVGTVSPATIKRQGLPIRLGPPAEFRGRLGPLRIDAYAYTRRRVRRLQSREQGSGLPVEDERVPVVGNRLRPEGLDIE